MSEHKKGFLGRLFAGIKKPQTGEDDNQLLNDMIDEANKVAADESDNEPENSGDDMITDYEYVDLITNLANDSDWDKTPEEAKAEESRDEGQDLHELIDNLIQTNDSDRDITPEKTKSVESTDEDQEQPELSDEDYANLISDIASVSKMTSEPAATVFDPKDASHDDEGADALLRQMLADVGKPMPKPVTAITDDAVYSADKTADGENDSKAVHEAADTDATETDQDLNNSLLSLFGDLPDDENTSDASQANTTDNADTTGQTVKMQSDKSDGSGSDSTEETVPDAAENALNEEDAILMAALGYDGDAITDTIVRDRVTTDRISNPKYTDLDHAFAYEGQEYRSKEQTDNILASYNRERITMYVRLVGTALFTLILFIYDVFGKHFGGAFDPELYPTVNILISLQFLVLAAALSYKQLFAGVTGVFRFDPTPHSLTAEAVILTVIYDIILAAMAPASFTLYNLPAAVCLLFTVLYDHLRLESEIRAFTRLSSWNTVCTLERVDSIALANELGENRVGVPSNSVGRAFRMRRGTFAENYFRRTNRKNESSKVLNYIVSPLLALAFVVFIISLAAGRTAVDSLNVFICIILFSIPEFVLVADAFPFYVMLRGRLDSHSVILNEADIPEYSSANTVVFEESDIFAADSLTINRLALCGNGEACDIYSTLLGTSALFDAAGGTVARAFPGADDKSGKPTEVIINSIAPNGIDGMVDGHHYLIGNDVYLTGKGISVSADYNDTAAVEVPGTAIMRISVDGEETMKLYVKYKPDERFIDLVKTLASRGIRTVLRSSDPNVDPSLIESLTGKLKMPIALIKSDAHVASANYSEKHKKTDQNGEPADGNIDGAILADGSDWSSIIYAADSCALYNKWSQLNLYISGGLLAVGVMLAAFLGSLGATIGMLSLYIVLFQILCALPTVVISKLLLN